MQNTTHSGKWWAIEIGICLAIVILCTIPRILFLDRLPDGLHNDEAWTAIDAREVLHSGMISPYTSHALGQPTGALYLTALVFRLFGSSIFYLRLSMALYGIATVLMFYILLRMSFSRNVSLFGVISLGFSLIHIHFSRLGFMLISAPFFQVLTLICLQYGLTKKNHLAMFGAAVACALGIHSYNTFTLFIGFYLVFIVLCTLKTRTLGSLWTLIYTLLTIMIIISPILYIVVYSPDMYFGHFRIFSIFRNRVFLLEDGFVNQFIWIAKYGFDSLQKYMYGSIIDYADGFGSYRSFSKIYLVLFAIGLIYIVWKRDLKGFVAISVCAISLVPLFTTIDGIYRRTILFVLPFYWIIACGFHGLLQSIRKRRHVLTFILVLGYFCSAIIISLQNIRFYFTTFDLGKSLDVTFTPDLVNVFEYVTSHGYEKKHLVFASSQWGCKFETIRFFRDGDCDDSSDQFGSRQNRLYIKNAVYVYMDLYIDDYHYLEQTYKSLRKQIVRKDGEIIAVIVTPEE